jgi:hypothetical protein
MYRKQKQTHIHNFVYERATADGEKVLLSCAKCGETTYQNFEELIK